METKEKTWDYGDYKIRYDEYESKFVVDFGEEAGIASRDTLKDAKLYCDNRDKRMESAGKKKIDPIEAYYSTRYSFGYLEPVVVTSFPEGNRYSGKQAWIRRHKDGSREKVSVSKLFVKDSAAIAALDKIAAYRREIESIEKKIDALEPTFKPLQAPVEA